MEITVLDQTISFLYSAFSGFILGMFFDFFKCLKNIVFKNKITRDFIDVIFVMTSAIFVFFSFYQICALNFRFYHICGFILGIVIYFCSVNRIVYKIFEKILIILREILKILLYPVKLFVIILSGFFRLVKKVVEKPLGCIKNTYAKTVFGIKNVIKRKGKI